MFLGLTSPKFPSPRLAALGTLLVKERGPQGTTLTHLGHLQGVNHSCKVPVLPLTKGNLWELLGCLPLLKLQRASSERPRWRTAEQGCEPAPCRCTFSLPKPKPFQLCSM